VSCHASIRPISTSQNHCDELLVSFSYNGIDSVNLPGRYLVLQNVYRVLRPGGNFVFSALNRDGSAHDDHWLDFGVFHGIGWSPGRLLHATGRLMFGGANRLRRYRFFSDEADVAIGTISAHCFGLVTLFTSFTTQLQQLADVGF
jgi:SAM-dependent methyltransferase